MCLNLSKEMCQSMLSTHTTQKSPNASIILNKEPRRKKTLWQCCVKWNVSHFSCSYPFDVHMHWSQKLATSCAMRISFFIFRMTFSWDSTESLFCLAQVNPFFVHFTQKFPFVPTIVFFFRIPHTEDRNREKIPNECPFCKVISILFVCIMQAIYEIV